jgi:hypothetical protein
MSLCPEKQKAPWNFEVSAKEICKYGLEQHGLGLYPVIVHTLCHFEVENRFR